MLCDIKLILLEHIWSKFHQGFTTLVWQEKMFRLLWKLLNIAISLLTQLSKLVHIGGLKLPPLTTGPQIIHLSEGSKVNLKCLDAKGLFGARFVQILTKPPEFGSICPDSLPSLTNSLKIIKRICWEFSENWCPSDVQNGSSNLQCPTYWCCGPVWSSSKDILPEPWTGLMVRFKQTAEPWTGPWRTGPAGLVRVIHRSEPWTPVKSASIGSSIF